MNDKCQPQEMPNKGVGVVAVDVIEVNKTDFIIDQQKARPFVQHSECLFLFLSNSNNYPFPNSRKIQVALCHS